MDFWMGMNLENTFCPRRTRIFGFLDGDDFGERFFVRGGLGFLDFWMGTVSGNTFCPRRTRILGFLDGDSYGEHLLSAEDSDSWIFGWG